MELFSYLTVYVSLILAIAVSRNLIGFAYLIEERQRVTWSWPFVVWGGFFVIVGAAEWWNLLDWREVTVFYFYDFLLMLVRPTLFFLLCALLFPRFADKGHLDLWSHLDRVRPWIFSFGGVYALMYLVDWGVQAQRLGDGILPKGDEIDWLLILAVAGLLFMGARIRSRHYGKFLPLAVIILFVGMFLS